MNRTRKTILCICVAAALCCLFALCGAAETNAVQLSGRETDNAADNNYTVWSDTMHSYLYENADGTLTRVEAFSSDASVVIETYSADGTVKKSTKSIAFELPLFGGFFAGADNNYLVFGQTNESESDSAEVLRVVKYSKSWSRLDGASVYGANTYIPFEAGSLRMAETGGKLYIHTCHEMYQSSDGYHHQANMTFVLRESDCTVVDSWYRVMNISYGYVSHSFNQFIATDGAKVYRVDHGDAHPRGIAVTSFAKDDAVTNVTVQTPLSFAGAVGDNPTGASVGGLGVGSSRILIAGCIDDQQRSYSFSDYYYNDVNCNAARNIFVCSLPKSLGDTGTRKNLTAYTDDSGVTVRTPQLVKVAADEFLLLWEEYNGAKGTTAVRAVRLNGAGESQSPIVTREARLSDCQPILTSDGCVTWYAGSGGKAVLYKIDPQNLVAAVTPAVPSNVKAAPYGDRGIRLTWTASDGATQYNIYRYNGTKKAYVYVGTAYKAAYYEGGLSTGVTYYYKVTAVNKSGGETLVSEKSAAASATTVGTPAVPSNVKAVAYGANGIRLSWTESKGATQYNIYRYNGTKKAYVYVGTAYKAAFYESGRSVGVTYYYKVTAVCKTGASTFVSEKSAAASAMAVGTPAVPSNVKAVAYGTGGIRLSWTESKGATQYNIYRYNGAKKAYVYVGTAYKAAYYEGGLYSGVTYYYKVVAVCKASASTFVSEQSAAVHATVN